MYLKNYLKIQVFFKCTQVQVFCSFWHTKKDLQVPCTRTQVQVQEVRHGANG